MAAYPGSDRDFMIRQLENIIRAGTLYGSNVSFYEKELDKWKGAFVDVRHGQTIQTDGRRLESSY